MTLNTNPKPVKPGGLVTVTGRVWPRPTGAVRLLRRVAGTSTWSLAATVTLGSGGRFTFHTTAVSSRAFKLGTSSGAVSPVVTLTVG